ncbi:hypothetical protein GGX14DRAFT_373488, partial [Mycena pura]
FSMIVSDTTANVKKCRALICAAYPWIFNCPDPCHQLNLLAKEVMVGSKRHPKTMDIVSKVTTYFSHSNYGKKHLKDKLKLQDDRRGLVSFGATRFSTFADQASSVSRCLDAMQKCYSEGLLKPMQGYFIQNSDMQVDFRRQLYYVNMLLKPISRGLKTLESAKVTCSDVFNIWIGIAIGFREVFSVPGININKYEVETFGCYNRRFAIFMNDCTPGLFILAYCLDPSAYALLTHRVFPNFKLIYLSVYYRDGALRLLLPAHRSMFKKETASPLVSYLIVSARTMLQQEQKRVGKGDESEGRVLVNQILGTNPYIS